MCLCPAACGFLFLTACCSCPYPPFISTPHSQIDSTTTSLLSNKRHTIYSHTQINRQYTHTHTLTLHTHIHTLKTGCLVRCTLVLSRRLSGLLLLPSSNSQAAYQGRLWGD